MGNILPADERRSLRRILGLLEIRRGGLVLSVFLGVCGMGAAVGLAATSAWLIARASQMPPVMSLTVAATSVRFFGISRAVFRYLQRLASHKIALEGMDSLRLNIYDLLVSGPIERVASLQRGDLLTRTGADVDTVGDFVVKSLLPTLVTFIVGAGTVIGFALLSVPAALVLMFSLLLSGVAVPLLTMKATRAGELAQMHSERDLSITTMTIMDGADELQVEGKMPQVLDNLAGVSSRINHARSLAARPAGLGAALDRVAMGIAVIGVLLVATPEVGNGAIAAVAFAVLVLTPLSAFEGTSELAPAAAQLVRSALAAKRIDDLLGTPVQPAATHQVPVREESQISAGNLAVGWPGMRPVAEGFAFALTPGKTIAVVGPSGIGKTTLLYTLAGMLEPKLGHADVNGVHTWHANRDELTNLVSLTTEDAHIFATSVYENLRVANPDLTREEATLLATRMGLGPWMAALPHGLETQLGSGGTSISGGERRRLLLGRALASPAPLMLLDEPGEHLDGQTASQILGELLNGTGTERGILLVTHRLSELSQADEIIVVEPAVSSSSAAPAAVSASGNHTTLLEESPYYRWALEQEQ